MTKQTAGPKQRKPDNALRLLLAYAQCEEAISDVADYPSETYLATLRKHGYKANGLKTPAEFLDSLRKRALSAARSALSLIPKEATKCPANDGKVVEAWTCFHCHETFTSEEAAANHFGKRDGDTPACRIDEAELKRLRALEDENRKLWSDIHNEDTLYKTHNSMVESELKGYKPFRNCRTINDVFNLYDSLEGEKLALEERLAQALARPSDAGVVETLKAACELAREFIASEYTADNDEGVLIPDANARRVHDKLCDALAANAEEGRGDA